jgi:hypothetical protein
MPTHNLTWLSGAALFSFLLAANAAHAKQEIDGRPAELGKQIADSACATSDDADESRICEGGRLRWRLCEQGFRSERLPNAGVYACFLGSL